MNHYYIIIFSVLILKCTACNKRRAESYYEIFTNFSSVNEHIVNYTAVRNKPLEFCFQNISISKGSCDDFYHRVSKLKATISNSTIHVTNVTYSMSTRWKCRLLKTNLTNLPTKHYYTLYVNLHVKGAKPVEMTVNDKALSFKEANISVPYDGDTDYLYEDGEHVHIVCKKPQKTGTVHLEYFSKDASNISNTTTFHIQLHSGNNLSYIECVYITDEPPDRYVYRITFVSKKPNIINLNESKTPPDEKSSSNSSLLLSCAIGTVVIVLVVIVAVYYNTKTRTGKMIEIHDGETTNKNGKTNECDNQYDECHYDDSRNYETLVGVQKMGLGEPYYTEIDYSRCKPKVTEAPPRTSYVYDEPYLH